MNIHEVKESENISKTNFFLLGNSIALKAHTKVFIIQKKSTDVLRTKVIIHINLSENYVIMIYIICGTEM